MPLRKIVEIDESKCDGCGQCAPACAEGAIQIINGKARLVADVYCDGLGACLGHCPRDAIRVIEREAPDFDEAAVHQRLAEQASQLAHWPVQLRLVPPGAPFLRDADVLLVADCVPFAMPDFHGRILRGRPVLIGCPKLDDGTYYVEKLAAMLRGSGLRSLTVVHMEVPCCTGLVRIAEAAKALAGVDVPLESLVVSVRGSLLDRQGAAR